MQSMAARYTQTDDEEICLYENPLRRASFSAGGLPLAGTLLAGDIPQTVLPLVYSLNNQGIDFKLSK